MNNNKNKKHKTDSFTCPECGAYMPSYDLVSGQKLPKKYFIECHMLKSKMCSRSVRQCQNCNELFTDNQGLQKHIRQKEACNIMYNKSMSNTQHQHQQILPQLKRRYHRGTTDILPNTVDKNNEEEDEEQQTFSSSPNFNSYCTIATSTSTSRSHNVSTNRLGNGHQRKSIFDNSNSTTFTSPDSFSKKRSTKKKESSKKSKYSDNNISQYDNLIGDSLVSDLTYLQYSGSTTAKDNKDKSTYVQSVEFATGFFDEDDDDEDDDDDDDDDIGGGEHQEDNTVSSSTNHTDSSSIPISSSTTGVLTTTSGNFNFPDQPIINKYTTTTILKLYKRNEEELSSTEAYLDNYYKKGMRAIKYLIIKGHSLKEYNEVMRIEDPNVQFYSLEIMMQKTIASVCGKTLYQRLKPAVSNLICPSGRKVNIITYDIEAVLMDMLQDKKMTCRKNMIFTTKNGNPFDWDEEEYHDDFNTCIYYKETAKKLKINKRKHVLAPVMIYMDKFILDSNGKLSMEPVNIMLMIYNRETRLQIKKWKVIGYIPKLQKLDTQSSSTQIAEEYAGDIHYCLTHILSGLRKIQENGGFDWEFKFDDIPGVVFKRRIIIPLGVVLGDTDSNNILCGHYNCYNAKYLDRSCTCPKKEAKIPSTKCMFLKMNDVRRLTEREANNLSFRHIQPINAFHVMDFGANVYGINGATPAEPLHQFLQGTANDVYDSFFTERLSPAPKSIFNIMVQNMSVHCGTLSNKSFPNIRPYIKGLLDTSKLTGKEKIGRIFVMYLVLLTKEFQKQIVGQKLYYPTRKTLDDLQKKGITSYAFEKKMTVSEYFNWIRIMEETLLYYSWLYSNKHPKAFFKGGRYSLVAKKLSEYVRMLTTYAPLYKGAGYEKYKCHANLHYWFVIRMFGSLVNIDTMIPEGTHRVRKQSAEHTQKRHCLLDIQTANQELKRSLFQRGIEEYEEEESFPVIDNAQHTLSNTNGGGEDNHSYNLSGSRFRLCFVRQGEECPKGINEHNTPHVTSKETNTRLFIVWKNKYIHSFNITYPKKVMNSVLRMFDNFYESEEDTGKRIIEMTGFTELVSGDGTSKKILRACPRYRQEKDWFDWIYLYAPLYSDVLPAQLLMLISMEGVKYKYYQNLIQIPQRIIDWNNRFTNYTNNSAKFIALVHQTNDGEWRDEGYVREFTYYDHHANDDGTTTTSTSIAGTFKSKIASWFNMKDDYTISTPDRIFGCAYVIHDINVSDDSTVPPGEAKEIIHIEPYEKWSDKFIGYNDKKMIERAKAQVDDYTFNEEDDRKPFEE